MTSGVSRRAFVQGTVASLLFGCSKDEGAGGHTSSCGDAFSGGKLVSEIPFVGEDSVSFGTPQGEGLDGRVYTDLSKLGPDTMVTPNELFYVRTRYPDLLEPTLPWNVDVSGLVESPVSLAQGDLQALKQPMGVHLLECSGNSIGGKFGLLSAAEWSGALLSEVLSTLGVRPDATRILISGFDSHSQPSVGGHSTPGASWILSLSDIEERGAFLALEMNGEPLPPDHGAPVRLFVPGWFGCSCIKWVNELVLVDDSVPATSQMQEFASRTHQDGVPALAVEYRAPKIQQAAMPVRIEKWNVGAEVVYRVVGILWGGEKPTGSDRLQIAFGNGDWRAVHVCPPHTQNATWTLWSHTWKPTQPGTFTISMRVDDPSVPQIRLDSGWYARQVAIDEV